MKNRNRSHRGGQRRHNNRHRDGQQQSWQKNNAGVAHAENNNSSRNATNHSVLPSPEILQEYEYACEGTVARLLEMAEVEQDRRNEWEKEYMRFHKKTVRIGQISGFLLLFSVIWGAVYLGNSGQAELAKVLVVSGFASVAAAGFFAVVGRRLSRRPRGFERK